MAKHTPGPWSDEDGNAITARNGKVGVACLEPDPPKDFWYGIEPVSDDGESAANARLIAAAPDLLAACEAALSHLEWANIHGSRCDEALKSIKAAIAKAEKGT